MSDPFDRLRADSTPVEPPAAFAAELRRRYLRELGGGIGKLAVQREGDEQLDEQVVIDVNLTSDKPRQRALVLTAAAVVMGAVLVAALVASRGRDGGTEPREAPTVTTVAPPTTVAPTATVVAGSPTTAADRLPPIGSLVAAGAQAFDDPDKPTFMAIAGDSVWIQHVKGPIVRRDKSTGEIKGAVPVADSGSYVNSRLAAGFGSLWLGSIEGDVRRIDIVTGEVTATISMPHGLYPASQVSDFAVGPDAVWILSGGVPRWLERIDPATNAVTSVQVSNDPISPVNVAYGNGSLWLVQQGTGLVTRVNPADGSVIASIQLDFAAWTLLVTDTGIWAPDRNIKAVAHIDPDRQQVVANVHTGDLTSVDLPPDVANGGGFVWESTSPIALLTKIDPRTNAVVARYEPGHFGNWGVAADDDAVWVSSISDGKVYRLPLR